MQKTDNNILTTLPGRPSGHALALVRAHTVDDKDAGLVLEDRKEGPE